MVEFFINHKKVNRLILTVCLLLISLPIWGMLFFSQKVSTIFSLLALVTAVGVFAANWLIIIYSIMYFVTGKKEFKNYIYLLIVLIGIHLLIFVNQQYKGSFTESTFNTLTLFYGEFQISAIRETFGWFVESIKNPDFFVPFVN